MTLPMPLPTTPPAPGRVLPTTVIGSFSVPEWLGQLKNDYYQRRISRRYLSEILDMATKAAIVDQARAGMDLVSDGELRRDNDVDYVLPGCPGCESRSPAKADYFDYWTPALRRPAAGDRRRGPRPWASPTTSGSSRADRPAGQGVHDRRRSRCRAGSATGTGTRPTWSGSWPATCTPRPWSWPPRARGCCRWMSPSWPATPSRSALAIEALNIVTDVPGVSWVLHVCYGNRYARPLWEGHYDFLFPAVKEPGSTSSRWSSPGRGDEDLVLLERYDWDRGLGLGVIDVQDAAQVETPEAGRGADPARRCGSCRRSGCRSTRTAACGSSPATRPGRSWPRWSPARLRSGPS